MKLIRQQVNAFTSQFSMSLNAYRNDEVMAVARRDDLSFREKADLIAEKRDEAVKGRKN